MFRPSPVTRSRAVPPFVVTTWISSPGAAREATLAAVLHVGEDSRLAGSRARRDVDDVDRLVDEVRDADHVRLDAAVAHPDTGRVDAACREALHVREAGKRSLLGGGQPEGGRVDREVGEPARRDLPLHRAVGERRQREDADARDRDREGEHGEGRARLAARQVGDRLVQQRRAHDSSVTRRRRRRRGSSRSGGRGTRARDRV